MASSSGILVNNESTSHVAIKLLQLLVFRLIISTIKTPAYKIAKFLVPVLSEFTINKYVVKDSFSFVRDIKTKSCNSFMATWDVDSLFTNIPLEEAIDLSIKKLYQRRKKVNGIHSADFKSLIELATKE